MGDGSSDDTAAVQAALDAAAGGIVVFPPPGPYKLGRLAIAKPMVILGYESQLIGTEHGIFGVTAPLAYLTIRGFRADFAGASGTVGKEFFYNYSEGGRNQTGSFGEGTQYSIQRLEIAKNTLGAAKVTVTGNETLPWIMENVWRHGPGVSCAPYYLLVRKGGFDEDLGPAWVCNNYFAVHGPKGFNQDIVKITGSLSNLHFDHNHVENLDRDCFAQVDVYTGAHKMRVTNNTLIDTQLHRKIYGQIPGLMTVYHYDLITGNVFEIRAGAAVDRAIYFIGSLGTITANQFILRNPQQPTSGFYCDNAELDLGHGTDQGYGLILANNLFDHRGGHAENIGIHIDPGSIGNAKGFVINGNLQLGGRRYVAQGAEVAAVVGNVWVDNHNPGDKTLWADEPAAVVGNVSDGPMSSE